jgi:hypothetical protein
MQSTRPTPAIIKSMHPSKATYQEDTVGSDLGGKPYLLGLEAKTASPIGTGGPGDAHDRRLLPVLPATHALHEPHHVRLLPPP